MASMLTKREMDLSQDVFEAGMKIAKVRVLLNDILNEYDFDKEPDEKIARQFGYDIKWVMTFIKIINDYIFETEKDLEQAQNRFECVGSED